MSINAYNKFNNAIFNKLLHYKLKSIRKINDTKELEKTLETATGNSYNIEIIKLIYNFIDATATEYIYSNGLKYLDSKIMYNDKNKENTIHTIRQITITTNYEECPIVNIVIEEDKKNLQQILKFTPLNDLNSKNKDTNLKKITIHAKGRSGSVFEIYSDSKTEDLILERYMQFSPISESETYENELLELCGKGTRYLEIVYDNKQPILAQISNKYKDEEENNNKSLSIDEIIIVEKINNEVDTIIQIITSSLDKYTKSLEADSKKLLKVKN